MARRRRLRLSKKDRGLFERLPEEQRERAMRQAEEEVFKAETTSVQALQGGLLADIKELKNMRRQIAENDRIKVAITRWTQLYEEYDQLCSEYNAFFEIPREERWNAEFNSVLARLISLDERLVRLLPETDPRPETVAEFNEMREAVPWELIREAHSRLTEDLVQMSRAERLASRPSPVVTVEKKLCKLCQKKEARLEGYCKKCARIEGIIVRGKIT